MRPEGIHAARNTLVNDASAPLADPGVPGKEKPRARQLAAGFHNGGTAMRKVSANKLSSSIRRALRPRQSRETSLQLCGPDSAEFGAPSLFFLTQNSHFFWVLFVSAGGGSQPSEAQ